MRDPMAHWLDYWDYLDSRFWSVCRHFNQGYTPEELTWQPIRQVASIGWNLRHLGEMLDHYLTKVFRFTPATVSDEPLITMIPGQLDDGRFGDLSAIAAYHRQVRPMYRRYLEGLTVDQMSQPLSPRANSHTVAWAVGHIAEHESYHLGKCTLLRSLVLARRGSA